MNHWKDGFIEANGIKIHYYRTGGDKPQVVLNHGAMDDGLCWARVVQALEHDYDVIMLDARGHGFSDSGQGDYTSETRANDLAAAIKGLNLDKPVVGGHSMGADASLYLAALYPEIPRAIFLEDPPIHMPGEPIFGGKIGEQGDRVFKLLVRIMKLFRALPVFMGKPLAKITMMSNSPGDEIIHWLHSKKRFQEDFLIGMASSDPTDSFPTAVLQQIKLPTLLIMGDRDEGAIVSKDVADKMAALIPGLRVAHLTGANHDIRRAKFEVYIGTLKTFLADVC